MRILAIETSCDETAIALVEAKGRLPAGRQGLNNPHFKILENLVASQIKIHRPFGGVVPTLAKREHLKNLPILFKKLQATRYKIQDTNLIAVTVGPGLEPCLWVGINFAKEVYKSKYQASSIKLLGVSHLEGHLYSFLLSQKTKSFKFQASSFKKLFPAVALIISGGHTILLLMKDLVHYKKLGETRDDAVGECFDKVARLLGLPYPGGPEIEKLAKYGNLDAINFPRPMINQKNYDFSFSGLKTAVLYYLKNSEPISFLRNLRRRAGMVPKGRASRGTSESRTLGGTKRVEGKDSASDIAASFQSAAFDSLISKTLRAAKEYKAKSILISGGVAANKTLQRQFKSIVKSQLSNVNFFVPPKKFCTDNAAMIVAAGYINYLRNKNHRLKARGNLTLK
jgi:N6-L-threonylcarbamoyladenine synthase